MINFTSHTINMCLFSLLFIYNFTAVKPDLVEMDILIVMFLLHYNLK